MLDSPAVNSEHVIQNLVVVLCLKYIRMVIYYDRGQCVADQV